MIHEIQVLDQDITLAINSLHSPFTDHVWMFFSSKTVWIPFYVLLLAFLVWKLGWKKALFVIMGIALTTLACDQGANIVKHSVERLRPCYDERMLHGGLNILEGRGGRFGFFSAHAADTFGLAACIFGCLKMSRDTSRKWLGAGLFCWAGMVSISRVFVGKHFFGDVLVGIAVGLVFGSLFAWIVRESVRRFART